jgi:hypothetical protein
MSLRTSLETSLKRSADYKLRATCGSFMQAAVLYLDILVGIDVKLGEDPGQR